MTQPLARRAAHLVWVAVSTFVVLSLISISVAAQSASTKRKAYSKARKPTPAAIYASPWVPNPSVTSKDSYLIIDASSGRELLSNRPDELRHPASLTKAMTLYLTFAALDSGRLSLGDTLAVSANGLNAPPTKMGMPGGTIMVRDAVMGLVTKSANDAAVVLAETLAGTEDSFARQMTQKSRQLGMASTVFRNASGLSHREQVTTARDMAKLAHALMRDFPHYYPVFSVQSYSYRGRSLHNHNRMLASYAGADGLKTGYTNASGFNLVMSAQRDNRRLIGVVMGGDTASQRDSQMADLMDRGFVNAEAMALSAWTSPRIPPSARYAAASFAPGANPSEGPRVNQVVKAEPAQVPTVATQTTPVRRASTAPAQAVAQGDGGAPAVGSWVIQIGSFGHSRAAQLALERASAALPNSIRSRGAPTVDEVRIVTKTFHRARVANLSQDEAVQGCKRLEQRKIFCAALQVTAWNTPGAR